MNINSIVTSNGERTLDCYVEFAGDICAIFWLFSDAELFAKKAAKEAPGARYIVVTSEGNRFEYVEAEQ